MENTVPSTIQTLNNPNNKLKTLHLVLLSIVTMGLFYFIHLWRFSPLLEEHLKRSFFNKTMLYALTICFALSGFFESIGVDFALSLERDAALISNTISLLLSLASVVIQILWAWNARNAIEQYATEKGISFEMSKIMTVLFGLFYINYLTAVLVEKEIAN